MRNITFITTILTVFSINNCNGLSKYDIELVSKLVDYLKTEVKIEKGTVLLKVSYY